MVSERNALAELAERLGDVRVSILGYNTGNDYFRALDVVYATSRIIKELAKVGWWTTDTGGELPYHPTSLEGVIVRCRAIAEEGVKE